MQSLPPLPAHVDTIDFTWVSTTMVSDSKIGNIRTFVASIMYVKTGGDLWSFVFIAVSIHVI